MKLVIGLGNIGDKYHLTRHNIGFMILDNLVHTREGSWCEERYYSYFRFRQTIFIKPKTYMNLSVKALLAAAQKWFFDDALIVHDDLELALANIRLRNGGGDGGHNGIKSLLSAPSPFSLRRMRIGIGKNDGIPAEKYVLQKFSEEELNALSASSKLFQQLLITYVQRDFTSMLDEYSKWKKTYSGTSESGIISPKED